MYCVMKEPEIHCIPIKGEEMVERTVGKSGNSGYLYVPVKWVGRRVKIILMDKGEG